jgi:hypothetical protein
MASVQSTTGSRGVRIRSSNAGYTMFRGSVKSRLRLKCDGTRAETRFRLSAKRTWPFKSAGASVQSTTGSRGVRISGSTAGHTMFRGSVKSTGYPLHSPVSPSVRHRVPSHFNRTLHRVSLNSCSYTVTD